MRAMRSLPALFLALAAGGCVDVDPHLVGQRVAPTMPQAITGTWKARAVYHSHLELLAAANLADALDLPGSDADEAAISYDPALGLTVRFIRGGEPIFEPTTYAPADGLHVDDDGSIELPFVPCSREDVHNGCSKHRRLYVNTKGQLVFVESGGGAGFIGLVPVGVYAKLLSKYVRAQPAAPASPASATE